MAITILSIFGMKRGQQKALDKGIENFTLTMTVFSQFLVGDKNENKQAPVVWIELKYGIKHHFIPLILSYR